MHRLRVTSVLFALLLCAYSDTAALGAESTANTMSKGVVSDGGSFNIKLKSTPPIIPLNEMFAIDIEVRASPKVKDPNPIWVNINAAMPAHKHGMNTQPRVEDHGKGHFVVRGMLFHMAGDWELTLDIAKGSIHEQAKIPLNIE